MEQLIRIVQKSAIKLGSIFEGDLKTARSNDSFSGYQETMSEFIESLKSALSTDNQGPVDVDLDKPAVNQLWDEVFDVIEMAREKMIPFLKLFGVEKGNGLSPLAVKIDTPADLSELITQFLKPPKNDSWVKKRVPNGDAPMPDTTNTGSQDDTNDNDDPVFVGMVDGEELEPPASIINVEENAPPPPVNVIAAHVKEINYLKQKETEGTEDCDCEYDFIGEE